MGLLWKSENTKLPYNRQIAVSRFKLLENKFKIEMTTASKETILPTILSSYALKDIFKTDKFSLFHQALSRKTMHFKRQRCSGGMHSKVCLTTFGERLPMLIIGKSQNLKCFKGVKYLPCQYPSQLKSWVS